MHIVLFYDKMSFVHDLCLVEICLNRGEVLLELTVARFWGLKKKLTKKKQKKDKALF